MVIRYLYLSTYILCNHVYLQGIFKNTLLHYIYLTTFQMKILLTKQISS